MLSDLRDDAVEATRTATHNVHISDRKVKVFASEVEESTLKQARELARMPFVWPHVALMRRYCFMVYPLRVVDEGFWCAGCFWFSSILLLQYLQF